MIERHEMGNVFLLRGKNLQGLITSDQLEFCRKIYHVHSCCHAFMGIILEQMVNTTNGREKFYVEAMAELLKKTFICSVF